uniref:Transmembrane protein 107 n=1 Tax=Haptolina brevifila TaxID=156173 RepID=A0A7S2JF83_9EUKA|mmetsp:Transcript_81368/g.161818  ORF Transcript_81368/g.161818 Transcript_81368/m.161818 type:complete len:261 (+) Transcript_81368:144-926(+)
MLSFLLLILFSEQEVEGVLFVGASVRRGLPTFTGSILLSMSAVALMHAAAAWDRNTRQINHRPSTALQRMKDVEEAAAEATGLLESHSPGCAASQHGSGALAYAAYWHVATCTMACAALFAMGWVWDSALLKVDMRPLAPHTWSLRTGIAHLVVDSPVMGAVAFLLLFGIPALTMALSLMAPWSARAHHSALYLSDACCLDVFVWAVLVYRFEESQLITVKWDPYGVASLLGAAALVASTASTMRCAPVAQSCSKQAKLT